ncbi:hypothetical protein JG688_00016085, partial [Phytophthora aleatoria]
MARHQRHVQHRCHGTEETVEGAEASRARIAITGSNSDESLGPRQPRKSRLLKKRKSKSYRVKTKTKRRRHGSRRRPLRDTGSSSSSASVTGESDNSDAKSDDLFGSSDSSGSAETNASTICDAGKDGGDVTAQDDLVSVPKLDVTTFDDWEELESYIKVYRRRTFQIYSVRTATPVSTRNQKIKDGRSFCDPIPADMKFYNKTYSNDWEVCITKQIVTRNHDVGTEVYQSYHEARQIDVAEALSGVRTLYRGGANRKRILEYIGENTTVQPAMKDNFPEVLLIDATHDTNVSNYKLFIFIIQDAVGKGQHVQVSADSQFWIHCLLENESMKVLSTLEGKNTLWFEYFDANWTNCKQRWSSVYRGNVPHMGNNTNNRLESSWQKLKSLVDRSTALDECVVSTLFWQTVNERAWARTINRVGVYVNVGYDDELNTLSNLVSRHAVELAKQQYDFALLPTTKYNLLSWALQYLAEANDDSTEEYMLNPEEWTCSGIFRGPFEIRGIHPPDGTRVKAQTEKFKELQAVGKPIAEIGCQWGTKAHAALTSTLVEFVRVVKTGSCPVTVCETPAVPDTISDTEENNEEVRSDDNVETTLEAAPDDDGEKEASAGGCGDEVTTRGASEETSSLTKPQWKISTSVKKSGRPKITQAALATTLDLFSEVETALAWVEKYDVGGWEPREAFWTEDLLDREA